MLDCAFRIRNYFWELIYSKIKKAVFFLESFWNLFQERKLPLVWAGFCPSQSLPIGLGLFCFYGWIGKRAK